MAGHSKDPLLQLSAALVSATASAQSLVVTIRAPQSPPLSGTLWQHNLILASEQVFPRADSAEIVHADGATIRAPILSPCNSSRRSSSIVPGRPIRARGAGTDPCCRCPGRTAGASRDRALARACLA